VAKRSRGAETDLPTPRTMLRTRSISLSLSCRSCLHRATADLTALVRDGRGDVPLIQLRWRCSECGSRRVSAVVLGYGRPRMDEL
jgi:ribosomal protein L44E